MIKKILVMGEHTIDKNQESALRKILGMKPEDKFELEIINVPINHIITHEEVKQYKLVISTQSNPIVLRRVNTILKKNGVTLIKPFKNNEGVLTHFMKIDDVVVDYKYELVKLNDNSENKQEMKKPFKKEYQNKKPNVDRNRKPKVDQNRKPNKNMSKRPKVDQNKMDQNRKPNKFSNNKKSK